MRFDQNKKQDIRLYILEKICQKDPALSKAVADTFGINQNTVHGYIKELIEESIIRRVKRGEYELVTQRFEYALDRSFGHLDSDTYAYDAYFQQHISAFPPNVREIWAYAFSEMVNNVMDHSQAEHLNLIVFQNYLTTSVLIIDDGVGIFRKIKEHFGYATLEDAIGELFKGKLTTDAKNHSGEGIFFSSKLMDRFVILSDRKLFTNNKYEDIAILSIPAYHGPGTCVFMSLSNFSNKKSHEVFDLYASVDGGFTKTRIPLKNVFDTSPVSRSQAKRICHRLEAFEEVILDFDGLEWMGQGFAHQIFVVFAQAHPQILLTPINMNEAVTKMYQHVTG
ncbi:MAG: DUF4325 domain-containing protein [Oscillospiraceae bacterium]|nr:DUF4325 domain-containing protein [Oscillospiraceae bacterium]